MKIRSSSMRNFFVFMLFLIVPFESGAADRVYLYANYYYGMSLDDVLKSSNLQCDDYPEGRTICNRQSIDFAHLKWTQFFEFHKNSLTCVAFGRPLSLDTIDATLNWFQNEKYLPINTNAGSESINYMFLYDKKLMDEFKKEYDNFNHNVPHADVMTAYLIKDSILDEYRVNGKIPWNAIMVTLGGSKRQGLIFVCFEPAKNFVLFPSE